jgi:hypothetical protein
MYEVLFLCRRGLGLTRGIGEKSNGSGPADEIYNGMWCSRMLWDWLESLSIACLTRSETRTIEEVQLLLAEVRGELKKPLTLCAYLPM